MGEIKSSDGIFESSDGDTCEARVLLWESTKKEIERSNGKNQVSIFTTLSEQFVFITFLLDGNCVIEILKTITNENKISIFQHDSVKVITSV